MIETISDSAQSQGLDPKYRFIPRSSISHDPGQVGHFRYPATVLLSIKCNPHAFASACYATVPPPAKQAPES